MDTFQNVTELPKKLMFSWHDYSIFLVMLTLSALIGIYYGFFAKKQVTADDYLLGGKQMGVFEISMSLISSHISGITILAVPADVYQYGSQYWMTAIGIIIAIIIAYYLTIPVFYKLQVHSTYEYLKIRFDERVRVLSSLLFTIQMFLYLPIVIYVPALALAQGTGFGIHYITPVVCGVCIFYTTIGGLKAVVWTDALQMVVMIFATIAVTCLGLVKAGGFGPIWDISVAGNRTLIDFDIDPTKRDTFWTVAVGLTVMWMSVMCFGQSAVQKCLSLPSYRAVQRSLIICAIGMFTFISCSVYIGLMIYARYFGCDPKTTEQIDAYDQLLPLYVLDVTENIPGLSGLFIAGVFSAALSSLSAAMNCLSCTIYEDFVAKCMPKDITQERVSLILKWLVAVIGIICTLLVFVIERLGSILPIGLSLGGITSGPLMGLFALGMFAPSCNAKGAFCGSISSLIVMAWIVFTSQYYKLNHIIFYEQQPLTVENCPEFNFTSNSTVLSSDDSEPWAIYKVSYYYYTLMGATLVCLIGLPISWIFKDKEPVDKDLVSPVMHWALPKTQKIILAKEYLSPDAALIKLGDAK